MTGGEEFQRRGAAAGSIPPPHDAADSTIVKITDKVRQQNVCIPSVSQ